MKAAGEEGLVWMSLLLSLGDSGARIPHWPLPAGFDLTRDGILSTYDESVLKLSKVSFRGKCARMGHPLKLPSPTKHAWLGHFPPASQAGCLAGPMFYMWIYLFFRTIFNTASFAALRFHSADGCCDRTQDHCNWCIGSQTF
jgi:hypothetical protein